MPESDFDQDDDLTLLDSAIVTAALLIFIRLLPTAPFSKSMTRGLRRRALKLIVRHGSPLKKKVKSQ